jgi:starch synthase
MHRILFVTSEAHPLAKTGGLGDVCGSLPPALHALGHDVRLLMPAYRNAKRIAGSLRTAAQLPIPFTGAPATLLEGKLPGSDVPLWLIDYPPAFDRDGHPYLAPDGNPWHDNAPRFALLCIAAVALARGEAPVDWQPDIVHCHDWQTGLAPALLAQLAPRPATVFTVHNLAYQGLFPASMFAQLGLPPSLWSIDALEFYGQLSFIKGGLALADFVSTVSPTYAREIQTPAFGAGMDGLLRHRADHLSGILNGIDTAVWDPATDAQLAQTYTVQSLGGKKINKLALQERMGLAREPERPLIGVIGRMVEQKGFDLILGAWPMLAEQRAQLAVLGSGEREFEDAWRDTQHRYSRQVAVHIGYDETLAHQIEGAADMFLMPSRFEPCGLNQMYSLRYGTVPIVRRVGGLGDTVVDAAADDDTATGIVFDDADPHELARAVIRALALYRQPDKWNRLIQNGMRQDFSWRKSANAYAALYGRALDERKAAQQVRKTPIK